MNTDLRMLIKLAIGFLAGAVLLMLAFSMEANADTHTPNQPGYWGEDCSKIDEYQGGTTWESDQTYRLVVLKAGTENTIFENVQQGQVLTSGKEISHIIVCPPTPTTSTSQPTSTSSTSPSSTTTVPKSTTTTQPPESTTTTDSPGTTSTTVQPSTTTTVSVTPSTPTTDVRECPDDFVEVGNDVCIPPWTPIGPPPTELPYTGSADYLWVLGLVLLAGGAGLIAFGRGKS